MQYIMVLVFTLVSVLAAGLLFLVQPMVARMVLPAFGGSPQVWTTAMLFFQTALLAGYGYSHLSTNYFSRKLQIWVHFAVLLVPLIFLPIGLKVAPSGRGGITPSLELLTALSWGVALPFIVIATSGPLVQRWFSWTNHARAHDPYFLYAAGNIGSIGGLLLYPFVVEPALSVSEQSRWWMYGYWLVAGLIALCGVWVMRGLAKETETESRTETKTAISWSRIGYWILLAFIPSSLMLGVTAHLSTDVASMPMLWVFPLVAYLLSFTIAFSRFGGQALKIASMAAPAVVVAAMLYTVNIFGTNIAVAIQILLMLIGGLIGHGKLAEDRPDPSQLTKFYLVLSIGGALGGLFNGLIAPLIFQHVFEYGLALTAMLALVTNWKSMVVGSEKMPSYFWIPLGASLFLLPLASVLILKEKFQSIPTLVACLLVLILVLPLLLPIGRSMLVCLGVGVASLIPKIDDISQSKAIERTFFGVHRVVQFQEILRLVHGTTNHGQQNLSSPESRAQPTTYYHKQQPLGEMINLLPTPSEVGVVGLGAGTIAAYATPNRNVTFHEIDPAVVQIAEGMFLYIKDARERGAEIKIELGDGRLTLGNHQAVYDFLAVDGFSSDAIPVHLLTVEAIEVYMNSIKPDGIVGIHVSNHYLDLVPVLAAAADKLNLAMLRKLGTKLEGEWEASEWVAVARTSERLAKLKELGWVELPEKKILWTDQRSSLWSVRKK